MSIQTELDVRELQRKLAELEERVDSLELALAQAREPKREPLHLSRKA